MGQLYPAWKCQAWESLLLDVVDAESSATFTFTKGLDMRLEEGASLALKHRSEGHGLRIRTSWT